MLRLSTLQCYMLDWGLPRGTIQSLPFLLQLVRRIARLVVILRNRRHGVVSSACQLDAGNHKARPDHWTCL